MSKMNELSQVLNELVACGEGLIGAASAIRDMFTDEPETGAQPAPTAEPLQTEADTGHEVKEPKKYSFADVKKACSAKSRAGYTEHVKALITSYGADKLSGVNEDYYASLMEDLEAIK